jgi:hypothetical protein
VKPDNWTLSPEESKCQEHTEGDGHWREIEVKGNQNATYRNKKQKAERVIRLKKVNLGRARGWYDKNKERIKLKLSN